MNNTIYLVIREYSCESSGMLNIANYKAFKDHEEAIKYFKEQKQGIIDMKTGYSEIEEEENVLYEEFENGEELYYNERVYIRSIELN